MGVGLAHLEVIFSEALGKSAPSERAAFLDQACGSDLELRKQVELLLESADAAGSFMAPPDPAQTVESHIPIHERPGSKIGRYKLLEQIGEGGFGVVFMAEQEQPVRRRVALKVIKLGMDTKQVVARFEAERQALAMMDHPNIAKVFDAGSTDSGRPYFVMELVKGIPISEYCDQQALTTRQRLDLFEQVCSAVQHAHQRGIIHRDIKPSNVMVTVHDDKPVPKVIDFGIAKATQARLTEQTLFTEFRQLVGTPAYMSPEQAQVLNTDIDTRSDIYSLGVVLYELLTGTTPFDPKDWSGGGYDEMRRIIREVEPPPPSSRISTLGAEKLSLVAQQRHCDPQRLVRLVKGDLDWIVMRCLEKDRTRRYDTAVGLAEDIQRHLSDEPVQARPPTLTYRARKFMRRNRLAVLAATSIAAAILLGLTFASIGFVQARRQTRIAQKEGARAQQTAQFLTDMLQGVGPSVAKGRDTKMLREIVDKSADRIGKDLKDQPEVRGDLYMTLGHVYWDIDDEPHGVEMLQQAVDSYRIAFGSESPKLALALATLGQLLCYGAHIEHGRETAQLGLDMARRCGDPQTLYACLRCRAASEDGWDILTPDSVPFLREALALQERLGNNDLARADCLYDLGRSLDWGFSPDSQQMTREALALHRQYLAPNDPIIAKDLRSLGYSLLNYGLPQTDENLQEAERCLRECVDLFSRVYDKQHIDLEHARADLAWAFCRQQKWGDAEAVFDEAINDDPSHPQNYHLRGAVAAVWQDWITAIENFRRARELEPEHERHVLNLAVALMRAGRRGEFHQLRHEFLSQPKHVQPAAEDQYREAHRELAKVFLLDLASDDEDLEAAVNFAQLVVNGFKREIRNTISQVAIAALLDIRLGRFESARTSADRVIKFGGSSSSSALGGATRALVCAHLGQWDDARHALAEADSNLIPERWSWDNLYGWTTIAIAEILRDEAAELIANSPTTTQP